MSQTFFRRTPKQARSRQRYEALLEAAAKLFAEKGFDGTTTNEIAQRAAMSIGSLYQYFDNKESLVAALRDRYLDELRSVTDNVLTADVENLSVRESVERLVQPFLQFHKDHPGLSRLWAASDQSEELRDAMRVMDEEVLARVETIVATRIVGITGERARVSATVMQATVKSLIGLLGRSWHQTLDSRLIEETQNMMVAFLERVVDESKSPGQKYE